MKNLTELKKNLDVVELEERLEMVQLAAAAEKDSQCMNGQCETA